MYPPHPPWIRHWMAVNGCFKGNVFSLRMPHFSFYLYHLLLLLLPRPPGACARLTFSENESRQSKNGAHPNHSRYPQRIAFEHTAWHDRYCRSVFHCDAWRVCVLFIVIYDTVGMYIHFIIGDNARFQFSSQWDSGRKLEIDTVRQKVTLVIVRWQANFWIFYCADDMISRPEGQKLCSGACFVLQSVEEHVVIYVFFDEAFLYIFSRQFRLLPRHRQRIHYVIPQTPKARYRCIHPWTFPVLLRFEDCTRCRVHYVRCLWRMS